MPERPFDTSTGDADDVGRHSFAGAVLAMVRNIRHADDDDEVMLGIVADAAASLIPGSQYAEAHWGRRGTKRLPVVVGNAASPAVLWTVQNTAGEGPTLSAVTTKATVLVADLGTDPRWPRFAASAQPTGIRSMLCLPLVSGSIGWGSITVVSTVSDAFTAEAQAAAAVVATHAGIELGGNQEVRNLHTALANRDLIGQAKGILMERERISADQAYARLAEESQHHNLKLHTIAESLCTTGELPARRPHNRTDH